MIPLLKNRKNAPNNSKERLISMNAPVLLGRHYAAYDRAITLLQDNIFAKSENKRSEIYNTVFNLLEISIQSHKAIPTMLKKRDGKDPILQYLLLLSDTVKAAHALVTHEMILFNEEKNLSNFLGNEITAQFHSTDEIFSNSELNILHCTTELITLSRPSLSRHREKIIKSFCSEDLIRFNKSFCEYTSLYSSY